jgi:hypothetical protein
MDCSCEQAKELMAGAWMAQLDDASAGALHSHLDGCADCAAEMAQLGTMWEKLGDLPAPEPSPALRMRWERTLAGFVAAEPRTAWWQRVWPTQPAWQMAIAGLCLAAGLGGGAVLERGRGERDEVAKLREEVSSTKELVALSLLQQQSASDRLRGVDYSSRMGSLEPQIVTALIERVNRDSNVNVRLAAVDALGKVANDSHVRASLEQALTQQDSPMVQAALIDYMVDARERGAVGAIRELGARPDVNPTVRERATYAVRQLEQ